MNVEKALRALRENGFNARWFATAAEAADALCAELKGKTIGGAQVSEKHAGFIVNIGGATTKDILDLIAFCQKTVQEQFGVTLETEVKIVGER